MSRRYLRAVFGLVVLLPLLAAGAARGQETATIADFAGRWEGVGLTESEDSLFFRVTSADLNVTITPLDDGFEVQWQALVDSGGTADSPIVRRSEMDALFEPTDNPLVFDGPDSGNPIAGGEIGWARLHGQTLTIYQMRLTDRGGYEVSSYDRTLTGHGMDFELRRARDGEAIRVVAGRLVRQQN